jgi:hypothetical protein
MPTSIRIPTTYSENKKRRRNSSKLVWINIDHSCHSWFPQTGSTRTRSQESAKTDCTSTYSKMGATLFSCKRICKCTHQSSDIASNKPLHPRLPSPSFQNEQESPMARWRRPRTLWSLVDRSQWLNILPNQTHHPSMIEPSGKNNRIDSIPKPQ